MNSVVVQSGSHKTLNGICGLLTFYHIGWSNSNLTWVYRQVESWFWQQTIGDHHMAGSLPTTGVARPIETSLNVVMQTDQIIWWKVIWCTDLYFIVDYCDVELTDGLLWYFVSETINLLLVICGKFGYFASCWKVTQARQLKLYSTLNSRNTHAHISMAGDLIWLSYQLSLNDLNKIGQI